eukprot:COSAG06_NODE_2381_length_6980_cov_11.893039_2_plen_631_part_00
MPRHSPALCFANRLGGALSQPHLAAVVAAREVLYIVSLLFATARLPVFLLLDLRTVWAESAPLQRFVRMAMYILTPHNYVALCCAARFPTWRRAFLGLAATQVIADLSSCFALAALLASTIEESADATTAGPLKVGYSITAFGFLLFFGPLSVATNLEAATDRQQHRAIRSVRGMVGVGLLLAWAYLMLIIVLLMFEEDVFCPGPKWFNGLANLQGSEDPCHGRGECYAAAQCHCDVGFAPGISSNHTEPLCGSCDTCWTGGMCSLSTVTTAWNQTQLMAPEDSTHACRVPSPTDFTYPDHYTVQPMGVSASFVPAADSWVRGKDDLWALSSFYTYGEANYRGGVPLPDGRVLLVPSNANHVGLYDPSTDAWREGKDDLSALSSSYKYEGGVLLPDGRVLLVPSSANHVGLYDPSTDAWRQGKDAVGSDHKYPGGVLLPDGRVLLVPLGANHVGLYDPSTDTWREGKDDLSAAGSSYGKYNGGVLLPDGRVLLVPYYVNHVGLYDPSTDAWREGKDDLSAVGYYTGKYEGGVLLPDGRVLLVPYYVNHVGLYDPSTDAWRQGKDDLSAVSRSGKYAGGVLLPDGRVLLVPALAKHVGLYDAGGTRNGAAYTVAALAPAENALLLPYYNKF